MKTDVLDKGYIQLVDYTGSDARVVNAARASFEREIEHITDDDKRLIKYLARNMHHSPFRHVTTTWRIKAPEFVMRQWYKHVVGAEWTSAYPTKDHAWNEVSGRYVGMTDFHYPEEWRKQSEDNKQGSDGVFSEGGQKNLNHNYEAVMDQIMTFYRSMITGGVAKEQARMILPISFYSTVMWTVSLQGLCNFMLLRDHHHAQYEIRKYAHALHDIVETTDFAFSYKEMLKWMRNSHGYNSTR